MHYSSSSNVTLPPKPPVVKNNAVNDAENVIVHSASKSSQTADPPGRRSYGSKGKEILLWTNSVELRLKKDMSFYRYSLSVKVKRSKAKEVVPEEVGKKRVQIMKLLLQSSDMGSLSSQVLTDFKSTLISTRELDQNECSKEVIYCVEGETQPRPSAKTYEVKLAYTKQLSISDLHDYFTSKDSSATYADRGDMIQAVNIFLNHYARTTPNIVMVGGGKTFQENSRQQDLGGGLNVRRGFYSSTRLATSRLLVNINVAHSVFYAAGSIWSRTGRNPNANLQRLALLLKGLKVKANHLNQHARKIHGLATQKDGNGLSHPPEVGKFGADAHNVKFWWSTKGKYISVNDFFKDHHGKTLQHPNFPVVNVRTESDPVYLPLEVCEVAAGQVARVKLSPEQTAKMIKFALQSGGPTVQAEEIERNGLRSVGLSDTNESLETFGISVTPGLIIVPGRVLKTPTVTYLGKTGVRVTNGSWKLMNVKFNKAGELKKWTYAMISTPNVTNKFSDPNHFGELEKQFKSGFSRLGIRYNEPVVPRLQGSFVIDPEKGMENGIKSIFDGARKQNVDLLFIVLPKRAPAPIYNSIKRFGDVLTGIATICIDGERLALNSPGHIANIATKLNLKLGGNNQACELTGWTSLNFNETMIVGIDVTHPSPSSSDTAPSIAGMVASVDATLGQWPAVVRRQKEARQEMVSKLEDMLESRLILWKKRHGCYPKNILVYRDGVSEGQYDAVLKEELPQLRSACKKLYPASQQKEGLPRFTVIIVAKRHHTRFYPTNKEDSDKAHKYNPLPGTIVDRGITEARNWDFFLQPHAALQGTARPIHYFVVRDEIFCGMPAQEAANLLEEITHNLCYIYGRSTTAVSVCTPAYYADLVCERGRCYLGDLFDATGQNQPGRPSEIEAHEKLKDTMFYI
ncbi:Piwi-domain-containing protein [Hypomontagnella submonticulosa]|nr:Piwi-domain-containing protein [Hypomontagnella submonticulosa]